MSRGSENFLLNGHSMSDVWAIAKCLGFYKFSQILLRIFGSKVYNYSGQVLKFIIL